MQLETIVYQSLDAAISASDQTEKDKTRKVELVPAWFATRHEQEEELTEENKVYFAQERERILAKLGDI